MISTAGSPAGVPGADADADSADAGESPRFDAGADEGGDTGGGKGDGALEPAFAELGAGGCVSTVAKVGAARTDATRVSSVEATAAPPTTSRSRRRRCIFAVARAERTRGIETVGLGAIACMGSAMSRAPARLGLRGNAPSPLGATASAVKGRRPTPAAKRGPLAVTVGVTALHFVDKNPAGGGPHQRADAAEAWAPFLKGERVPSS